MTPQESAMLNDLLGKVQQARAGDKDPQAAALIVEMLGTDPDALYILSQAVLAQQVALGQAKAQMDQMHQQVTAQLRQIAEWGRSTAKHPGSFLGGLLEQSGPERPARPEPRGAPLQEFPSQAI